MKRSGKMTEHEEQKALIMYARMKAKKTPIWSLLFSVPNGGRRTLGVAKKMKAEGQCAGIPDLFLPVGLGGYHGLFLELKVPGGSVSAVQKEWIKKLKEQGYKVVVAYGFEMAAKTIEDYLKLPDLLPV